MKRPPLNSLFPDSDKDTKIVTFLKSMPSLYFSDKGLENIANRFNISIAHLQILIDSLEGGNTDGK